MIWRWFFSTQRSKTKATSSSRNNKKLHIGIITPEKEGEAKTRQGSVSSPTKAYFI